VITIAFYAVVFGIDAAAGLYVGLHWHLVSTPGVLGLPLGALVAFAAALTSVSIWVLLFGRTFGVRLWTALVDAGVFAWLVLVADPQLSGSQGNFLGAAVLVALITTGFGIPTALFWLPLPERAGRLEGSSR
jgi:hypothetical protein